MQLPERNVQLFQRTLDHSYEHPEQHDQNVWVQLPARADAAGPQSACGTAACPAGRAVLLSGYVPHLYIPGIDDTDTVVLSRSESDVIPHLVPDLAQGLLGITDSEADVLFDAQNSPVFLWHFSQLICNGRLTMPADMAANQQEKRWAREAWDDIHPDLDD